MTPAELAAIRERAEEYRRLIDKHEGDAWDFDTFPTLLLNIANQTPALLDHIDWQQAQFQRALDGLKNHSARLWAIRELITEFETRDIMPIGQTTLLRNALEGDPPEPHVPYLDAD